MRGASAILVLAVVAAGGCSTSTGVGDTPFRPELVPENDGVIYVYRDVRRMRNRALRVVVDQRDIGALEAGRYLAIAVTPGAHLVRVTGVTEEAREITVRAGESAYVRVLSKRFRARQPRLELPDADRARAQIATTARAAPPGVEPPALGSR